MEETYEIVEEDKGREDFYENSKAKFENMLTKHNNMIMDSREAEMEFSKAKEYAELSGSYKTIKEKAYEKLMHNNNVKNKEYCDILTTIDNICTKTILPQSKTNSEINKVYVDSPARTFSARTILPQSKTKITTLQERINPEHVPEGINVEDYITHMFKSEANLTVNVKSIEDSVVIEIPAQRLVLQK